MWQTLPYWVSSVLGLQLSSQIPDSQKHITKSWQKSEVNLYLCVYSYSAVCMSCLLYMISYSFFQCARTIEASKQHWMWSIPAHLDVIKDSEQCLPNFCEVINEVIGLAAANQVIQG